MRQEGEPSVEEILESIKKVIARDQGGFAQTQPRKREALVARVETPEPADEEEANDVLDLGVIGAALNEDASEEALIESEDADEDDSDTAGSSFSERLTNDAAAEAMRQSLAALAMLSDPPARPQIVRQGETSLEGLVREMMRPMLAKWLDANLPDIVERLVKAEIARIAGKKS
ncbi:DUF2497 domain-containing protein [Aurantiacibacter poecillastricola]|uniref:DUF2497 domain-containing protein n=1 Tax=Aurantiacibacter poecillastricola TaxID=3064385 RepID=UPI00273E8DFE|nr:DUF2497 domain-containing protein [Aurantiacibacter sp. 219JJ12-13]MDP5260522.1 DUF2497 domain-containing protein [Aurantiacibacter sp. 219JJ12-13]